MEQCFCSNLHRCEEVEQSQLGVVHRINLWLLTHISTMVLIRNHRAFSISDFFRDVGEKLQSVENKSLLAGLRAIMPDKSELIDISNDLFAKNAAIVKEQAQGLPVYYTEWNENAIFSAYTNDTRKVASYIVKAALDVEQSVTASSVWCFSDLFEEFHVFPQQFHGGFGLQTIDGVPKPS